MKGVLGLLTLFLVSCTCSHRELIEDAEEFLDSGSTDSALTVIHKIHDLEKLENPLLARYALAVSQIHVNKGEALSEDSMLCSAYNYYRTIEPQDTKRLLQATVLISKYYWWNGNKKKAYDLLKSALEKYEGHSSLLLLTLHELYAVDNDFDSARRYLNALIESDEENTNLRFQYLYNLGTFSFYTDDREDVEKIFSTLEEYLRTPQDSMLYWKYALRTYADISSDFGDQQKAIRLQRKALDHFLGKDSTEMSFSYASFSRYYLLLGNLDEARRYLRLADNFATEGIRNDLSNAGYYQTLHILLDYAQSDSFSFKDWALFVNNLQESAEHKQQVIEAKEQYSRQLDERNLHLVISRQKMQITAMYTILGLILVIVSLVFYNRRKRTMIEEKEEELEALRQLLADSQQQTDQKDDRFFKKVMLQQLGVIRMAASNPTAANQEMLKQMSEIANKKVEVDALLDWDLLYKTIDYIYDGYYSNLKSQCNELLNEKEIQLCCLLRASFSTKEISIVTQQGVRTVYQRKTIIRQKLCIEEKGDIVGYTTSLNS